MSAGDMHTKETLAAILRATAPSTSLEALREAEERALDMLRDHVAKWHVQAIDWYVLPLREAIEARVEKEIATAHAEEGR